MGDRFERLLESLYQPAKEFSPIPFWFLNDFLDKECLRAQLLDFKDKGVDGVVLHPRIGIPKELVYLSEEYFEIIKYIVQTASQLDMAIVLYDEAMYPSGSAHGQVAAANPAFASIGLTLTQDPGNDKVIVSLEDGKYLVQRPCKGTIRGIHFGEDDGEPKAPASADILNPNAVDYFLQLTHEQYYKYLKIYFGNTIIGFFTDEPDVLGRNTKGYAEWTDGLEQEIVRQGGRLYELRGLFEGNENDTVVLYRKIVHERLNRVYYARLSEWCQRHSIALMGHPKASDDIDEEKYFQIPGQDLIFRRVSPETGGLDGLDSVQAKCSADAARHLGRRRNLNECFGVCCREQIPWYMTAGDMKWFIDWLGVRGVNLFIPHAFFYSVRGARSGERPPDVGPNNIWWKHYRLFSDYMKRISLINTDSRNGASIAVLCASGAVPYEEVKVLYENQIEFNYVQESVFSECRVENGRLRVAGYEYLYVLDPCGLAGKAESMGVTGLKQITQQEISDTGIERDFLTEQPCPRLRVSHLVKEGEDLYFLFNEGTKDIRFQASVPFQDRLCRMDLWNGKVFSLQYKIKNGRSSFELALFPGESCLLIRLPQGKESFDPELPAKPDKGKVIKVDNGWSLESEDKEKIRKIYTAGYTCSQPDGTEVIAVSGEEMIECFCNGKFAGVSFFPPHQFSVGEFLQAGENKMRLVVTGNIANRYSGHSIAYGLKEE